MRPACTHARPSAFTLAELLIAMAITSIILLALLQIFSIAMSAWNTEAKRESSLREARSGLHLFADDLQNLCALPASLPATVPVQRFILIAPQAPGGSSAFAFLRSARQNRHITNTVETGNLQLVAYTVALSKDTSGNVSQKLWRKELDPQATLERIERHLADHTPLMRDADWATFRDPQSGIIRQLPQDFGHEAEPLVYDLIRCLITPLIPINNTTNHTVQLQVASSPWPAEQIPTHLDLTLRVTNRATAGLLQNLADWTGTGTHAHLINGAKATSDTSSDDAEVLTHSLRLRLPAASAFPP